jgi:prephenate dehydrogenase
MSEPRRQPSSPDRGRVERLAIVGLGLLGGSLAGAARIRRLAGEVVGCVRRPEAARRALEDGLVDRVETEPAAAVAGADLVVLSTPVGVMAAVVGQAVNGFTAGAVVTDVGSVKAMLAETLPGLLPPGVTYVGSHPMAGSHRRGPEHARPDLFEGAACIVTPTGSEPPAAVARVEAFWRAVGARVLRREPAQHDREVAWTSHLPHVVAFAFARAFGEAPAGAREVTGPGFRDFTRIARSDAELWADILAANSKVLGGPLARFAAGLAEAARCLEAGDVERLERWIAEARASLDGPLGGEIELPGDPEASGTSGRVSPTLSEPKRPRPREETEKSA